MQEIYKLEPKPDILVLGLTYLTAARIIEQLGRARPRMGFAGFSFTGIQRVMEELGDRPSGVLTTQVVPLLDTPMPATRAFCKAAEQHEMRPNLVAFEGYLAALFLRGAFEGDDYRAQSPSEELELRLQSYIERDIDLGLLTRRGSSVLRFDPEKRQLLHQIWPTIVRKGRVVPLAWESFENLAAARAVTERSSRSEPVLAVRL